MPTFIYENLLNNYILNGDDFPKVTLQNNIVTQGDNNYSGLGTNPPTNNFFYGRLQTDYPNNIISSFHNVSSVYNSYSNKANLSDFYVTLLGNVYMNPNQNSNLWYVGSREINLSSSYLNIGMYLAESLMIGALLHYAVPYNNYFIPANSAQITYTGGWTLSTVNNAYAYETSNAGAYLTITPTFAFRYLIVSFMTYNNTTGEVSFNVDIDNEIVGVYKFTTSAVSTSQLSFENYVFIDLETEKIRTIKINRLGGLFRFCSLSPYTDNVSSSFSKQTLVVSPLRFHNYLPSANASGYGFQDRFLFYQKSCVRFCRSIGMNVSFLEPNFSISGCFFDTGNRFLNETQANAIYDDFKNRGLTK